MGELKDRPERGAEREGRDRVEDEDLPERMKQRGNHDRPAEEEELPADEPRETSTGRGRHGVNPDPAGREDREVVVQDPLREEESVQEPQVEVLKAMPRAPGL